MSAQLVGVDEYLSTAYDPDCEYVDGEIVERTPAETDHSSLQILIGAFLTARYRKAGIRVFAAPRLQIAPSRFRIPDLLVTTARVRGGIVTSPPFICIEILSPGGRLDAVEGKLAEYVRFGVLNVWLIDPRRRKAWVYSRDGRRESSAVLETTSSAVRIPLADLLNQMDEDVDLS